MQSQNRFFDDFARMAGGAMGAFAGIRQEIESRHIVLDMIDALQVAIEYDKGLFELVKTAGDGGGAGLAGDHVMRGRHDDKQRRSGDDARHHVDARIDDEAHGEGGCGHGHGDEDDHIEQAKTPGGSVRSRSHGSSLRLWPVPQGGARASTPTTSIDEDRRCSSLRAAALAAKTINPAHGKDQTGRGCAASPCA